MPNMPIEFEAMLAAEPLGTTSDRYLILRGIPLSCPCSTERLHQRAWVGGEREADQRRKRVRPGLLHDGRAMVLDRALADAEIGGNVLARMTGEHQLHDLALAPGQTGEACRRCFLLNRHLRRIPSVVHRAF